MEAEMSLLGEVSQDELASIQADPNEEQTIDLSPQAQKFQKPEELPSEFWDEATGAYKGDEIFKALKSEQQKALGLRQKLSQGVQNAPDEPSKYEFVVDEDMNIDFDPSTDPAIQMFKEISYANKLSQEQFNGVIKTFLKAAGEGKFGNAEANPEHAKAQAEQFYKEEINKLGEQAPQIINNVKSWGRSLVQQGIFSEDDYKSFMEMGVTASQVRVMNLMRQAAGYINDIPLHSSTVNGAPSQEEISAIMGEPDYWNNPAKQKKVADFFNTQYS